MIDTSALNLLLVRRQRFPDESWPGYLLRVVAQNELGSMKKLAQLCGTNLVDLISIEAPSLIGALPPTARKEKKTSVTPLVYSRVCPQCLLSDAVPYVRNVWDHPYKAHCELHRTWLLDQCYECGRRVDYRRRHVERCLCGASYKTQNVEVTPPWVETLYTVIKQESDGASNLQDELRFLKRLTLLNALVHGELQGSSARVTNFLFASELKNLAGWFDAWPKSFLTQMLFTLYQDPKCRGYHVASLNAQRIPAIQVAMRTVEKFPAKREGLKKLLQWSGKYDSAGAVVPASFADLVCLLGTDEMCDALNVSEGLLIAFWRSGVIQRVPLRGTCLFHPAESMRLLSGLNQRSKLVPAIPSGSISLLDALYQMRRGRGVSYSRFINRLGAAPLELYKLKEELCPLEQLYLDRDEFSLWYFGPMSKQRDA